MNFSHRLARTAIAVLAVGLLAPTALAEQDSADVVIEWNQILQDNIPSTASLLTPRFYATMHVAIFDAVNAIEGGYAPYRVGLRAAHGASAEAAAAQAAHDVLVELIPADEAVVVFDAALAARLSTMAAGPALRGAWVGARAAKAILAWRRKDGSDAPSPAYLLPPFPGSWQPVGSQVAAFVHFGDVEPFALLTPTQFLPRRPPTLTSDEYSADFDEVRRLGSADSTERTVEQTELALLFAPVGYRTQHWAVWNNVARDAAQSRYWSLVDTARLFALLNVSIHDGLQTSHSSKYVYGLWRPVTAIQRAAEDLNPDTIDDAAWQPLIGTPAYPSHPSNQTCVGTSAARALARAFGTNAIPFTVTWLGNPGVPDVSRSYTGFRQLAGDQARSRVYGGIHFTFELTASRESCTKVADYVFENYMRPRRFQPR